MDSETLHNWLKIKDHFETLSEDKRNNMFYRRAVAICSHQVDPLDVNISVTRTEVK